MRVRTGAVESVEAVAEDALASGEMPPESRLRNLPTPRAGDRALIEYGGHQGRLYDLSRYCWISRCKIAAYVAVVVAYIYYF